MTGSKALLVLKAGSEAGDGSPWAGLLDAAPERFTRVSGPKALELLRRGEGRWVAFERIPGWPALVRGVHDAGGRALLLGPPPDPQERARVAPLPLPSAGDPAAALRQLGAEAKAAEGADPLDRLAEVLAGQPDLAAVAREACARLGEALAADAALLFLVDPATGALRLEAGEAGPEEQRWAQELARQAQPWSGTRGGPAVATPLSRGGDVIGVWAALRTPGRPPFAEGALGLLVERAPAVAWAVETARVQARADVITRAKREWEQTFDAIFEPLAVQDGFTLRRANLAWAARAGVPIQTVPGSTCHELLAGRDTPCPGCPLLSESSELAEVELRGARFVVSRFSQADAPGRAVLHYRDVTEQRRLEARLRESERMASVGQLASGAAHEINNPLSFVISNLRSLQRELLPLGELLQSLCALQAQAGADPAGALEALQALRWELDPEDLPQLLAESLEGASRVAAIVKALRDLSRLEVGEGQAAPVAGSVSRAIRAELGDLPSAVETELTSKAPAKIPPLQLDQVLGQLLRNARQAVADGGRIRVRAWDEASQVVVEISDEGKGIRPADLPRIFEPFFTTRGVGQGIGLGLTSAYGIVQRHGGTLEARSVEGEGATFTLRLPRA